jgi:hypothetical protein
MGKNKRLYLISEEVFNRKVLPIIEGDYIRKGHPPKAWGRDLDPAVAGGLSR